MAKKPKADKESAALKALMATLNTDYGEGAVMQGRGSIVDVAIFPTGVASIDTALGVGGIPQGRIIELFGGESCGKTTSCLCFVAACQHYLFESKERHGVAAFIDAEHAFDPQWAEKNGVDMDKLLMCQPSSGEEALQITDKMCKSGAIDLIIVDSVAALTPQSELDGEIGDSAIGVQARMMSQAMRKLKTVAAKSLTTIIFINQVREKIGVFYGNPETTPGGRALKFYASIRAQISKGSAIKSGTTTVGFSPTMKFIKNKVAPPFTSAKYDICVGHPDRPVFGIDKMASLVDVGTAVKVISRSGSQFKYADKYIGNGMAKASQYLNENPQFAEELRQEIYDKALGQPNLPTADIPVETIEDELINDDT